LLYVALHKFFEKFWF